MIIVHPWAQKLPDNKINPKNPPKEWWEEVVIGLKGWFNTEVYQVGVKGEPVLWNVTGFKENLPYAELRKLTRECDTWVAVDSFFQHLAWDVGKRGVAVFGQSDPNIFGHAENINLLKDRNLLREKQFWWWTQCEYRSDVFVEPVTVLEAVSTILTSNQRTIIPRYVRKVKSNVG